MFLPVILFCWKGGLVGIIRCLQTKVTSSENLNKTTPWRQHIWTTREITAPTTKGSTKVTGCNSTKMSDPFFKLRCFARVWRRKIWQSPVTWRYQKHTGQAKQPAKPQWHSPASGGSEGSVFRRYTNKNTQMFKCFVCLFVGVRAF